MGDRPHATRRIPARAWVTALALGALGATPAQALFEDLPVSPRARALGEAMTAAPQDAYAFYYNPAGLPRLDGMRGGVTTVRPNGLGFNRLTTLALAVPLRNGGGGFGFGWRRYNVEYRDVDLVTENTLSVSHGFMLFRDASTSASVGVTVNFMHAEFAPTLGRAGDGSDGVDPGSTWAFGVDVGGMVAVYDRTQVGFFARNLNNPTIGEDEEELRQQVGVGVAYDPYPGVTTSIDVRNGLGEQFRIHGGMEFEVLPELLLRFGIETEPSKLSGGFAVRLPAVDLDYGFSTGGGVLDSSHHFGLSARLDLWGEATP